MYKHMEYRQFACSGCFGMNINCAKCNGSKIEYRYVEVIKNDEHFVDDMINKMYE